jgi:hypothetical protein
LSHPAQQFLAGGADAAIAMKAHRVRLADRQPRPVPPREKQSTTPALATPEPPSSMPARMHSIEESAPILNLGTRRHASADLLLGHALPQGVALQRVILAYGGSEFHAVNPQILAHGQPSLRRAE